MVDGPALIEHFKQYPPFLDSLVKVNVVYNMSLVQVWT